MQDLRLLQLYPSRITLTNPRTKKQFHEMKFNSQCRSFFYDREKAAIKNFATVKNPFIISKASKKKIMDSINSMYCLSQPRKVEMKTGKIIFNYRLSFVTLTLPSKQIHSDTQIKKDCLNQFLIELRKNYGVDNYVWKAELQKNENIHFHIILDKYIDFQALRRRWNRIINKLGYVTAYSEKFQKINLSQYHATRNRMAPCSFEKSKTAYAAGERSKWLNPNSVDVKSVYSKKDLAVYLSKYITKPVSKNAAGAENLERELAFGRAWYRSYSLSSLKYQNKFLASEMQHLIKYLLSVPDKVLCITQQFFTAFYFSPETLSLAFQEFHKKYILANALMYRYPIPT